MKITSAAIILIILPFTLLSAQEKKTEKKIKIITNDGSGNHVVIDTVFTGNGPDSMKLKDGSVVYLRHEDDSDIMPENGKHQIMIATTSDEAGNGVTKEITIVQGDSSDSHHGDKGDVMIFNNSPSGNMHYKVIRNFDGDADHMYSINKNSDEADTFNVFVTTDDHDGGIDKSRFVIAKDGMVVTVEGTDEAKTEALAKEIREKLGVKSETDNKSQKSTKKK